jgi:hypothetical protein
VATRLGEAVTIDGELNEAVWRETPATDRFLQRDPSEGAAATERTELRLAYDDAALYVAARMHDSDARSIVARLGRRDAWLDADTFYLYLDPYHDRRSGFLFSINAAGTLYDAILYNDDWDDVSWDGVWEARARVDAEGWTAEMRIPYSQLRFNDSDSQRWGVNARRHIARKKEDAYLAYKPRNASGFVSRFLDLVGIERITPPRRLSLLPYAIGRSEFTGREIGDPFHDGSRHRPDLGMDAKLGLGTSLTLDLTANPDFGQVEVDPAVVNLSDVETFYEEKRPFFLEGASIFDFGSGGASNYFGFNWWGPDLFYSRRIGRAPQGGTPDADFVDSPSGVSILGAAKLTGKLGGRWNVGTLHALTSRESARIATAGLRSRAEVEPGAYYGVLRAQRDFPDNRHGLGLIATAVVRDFGEPALRSQLSSDAMALGFDGWSFLDAGKTWVVTGWLAGSQVRGSAERITALQQSAQHYFQRPDASHVELDPSATSLSGMAGRVTLNKEKGLFLVNAALGMITPGFDVNDAGFLGRTDLVNGHLWASRRWTEPTRLARSANLDLAFFRSYDFDGNRTWDGVFLYGGLQLLGYHRLNAWVAYNPETVSNNRTRGGPLTANPSGWEWDLQGSSDERKRVIAKLSVHGWDYALRSSHGQYLGGEIEWRPSSNLSVSVKPGMEWSRTAAHWIGSFDDPLATATFGRRYVFAGLEQKTFSAATRVNWTFTPQLSLQVYAQPLFSSGEYSDHGELARPRSYEFLRYGTNGSTLSPSLEADPDGAGPAPAIALERPDFNLASLRGNAILRWEFRPGSTAYLVWTQSRSDAEDAGTLQVGRSLSRLLDTRADNIVLVKLAYWWGR